MTPRVFLLSFLFLFPQGLEAATYLWPLSNSTTPDPMNTSFGPRIDFSTWDMHDGMDLPAPLGTTVYNARGGTVYKAGPAGTDGYSSRHVVVQTIDPTDGTIYLLYIHLDTIDPGIIVGAPVSQSQVVGTVGMDDATYTHCHFEFRKGNPSQVYSTHPLKYMPYTDTANFTAPLSDRFNRKGGAMAARLLFGAPDKNEGDLRRVEVDVKQGSTVLSTRVVDFNDKTTLPEARGDQYVYTNDIGVEGYQTSNMVLDGRTDLKYGVLVKNLPGACDNLVARVYDMGGNIITGSAVSVTPQAAVSQYLDFEDGLMPPTGWTKVTSASGTGTSAINSAPPAHTGGRGMFCQDLSTTETSTQRAGIEYALPAGRFEWLGEAWVEPVSLGLAPGDSVYPLAFFSGSNTSVAARIRNQGGSLLAGIIAKKPDGTFTGIDSAQVIPTGVWHKWSLAVLRVGTRETTAVLYLDGVEAARLNWDSTVYEPQVFRAGVALSSTAATAELNLDEVRIYEDADEVLPPTATPTPTPTFTAMATFTPTASPTSSAWNSAFLSPDGSGGWLSQTVTVSGRPFRLDDYSYSGYKLSQVGVGDSIPCNSVTLAATGDVTIPLNAAITTVAGMGGGTVYIPAGTVTVSGSITIRSGNIRVAGAGSGATTVVVDSSYNPADQSNEGAFTFWGGGGTTYSKWEQPLTSAVTTSCADVNRGDTTVTVGSAVGFAVGDWVVVQQYFWPTFVNNNSAGVWTTTPGATDSSFNFTFCFPRKITAIAGSLVTLDAPIPWTLQNSDAVVRFYKLNTAHIIQNVGLESLSIQVLPNSNGPGGRPVGTALSFKSVFNGWARDVKVYNVARNGIRPTWSARITLLDCEITDAQDTGGGGWGYGFYTYSSSEVLYKRCQAHNLRHNYTTDYAMSNAVVWTRCLSDKASGGVSMECDDTHLAYSQRLLWDMHTDTNTGLLDEYRGTQSTDAYETYGGGAVWNHSGTGANPYGYFLAGTVQISPALYPSDSDAILVGPTGGATIYDNSQNPSGSYVYGTVMTGSALQTGPRGNVAYEGIERPGLDPPSLFDAQLYTRMGHAMPPEVASSVCGSTPTATPTVTPSFTPTRTFTRTSTPTPTLTLTPSLTSTFTLSATPSFTASATGTPTQSPTGTLTLTATPSPTFTPSPALTPTWTTSFTPSPTPTFTLSATPSSTASATATPTSTPTVTNSVTLTPSSTASRTPTPSFTSTGTPTASPTSTPTSSFSPTFTPTPTNTAGSTNTFTRTLTPSQTFTLSVTPSFTPSATASRTSTSTSTPTGTPSPSATPTVTKTMTVTGVTSVTPTDTPIAGEDRLSPNPWDGTQSLAFTHTVAPGVSSVELKIFTVALRKIYDDPWLDVSPGQHLYSLDWNEIGGMANGFYYLVLTESSGGRQTRKIMKLLVQR